MRASSPVCLLARFLWLRGSASWLCSSSAERLTHSWASAGPASSLSRPPISPAQCALTIFETDHRGAALWRFRRAGSGAPVTIRRDNLTPPWGAPARSDRKLDLFQRADYDYQNTPVRLLGVKSKHNRRRHRRLKAPESRQR